MSKTIILKFLTALPMLVNNLAGFVLVGIIVSFTTYAQEPKDETAAQRSATNPAYSSRDARNKELLAKTVPEESLWLETQNGKLLALYRRTETKDTNGALLLLHATEDPQTWPPLLENLRFNLPHYGWETLAITLPKKNMPPPPKRNLEELANIPTSEDENTKDLIVPQEPTTATPPRDQVIQSHLEALIKFMAAKGNDKYVLLVDNSVVIPSMQYFIAESNDTSKNQSNTSGNLNGPLQALIVLNTHLEEPLSTADLESIFKIKNLPVMDVFLSADTEKSKKQRRLHRAVAKRSQLLYYRQYTTNLQPKITEGDAQSFWLAQVRGFMQQSKAGLKTHNEKNNTSNK